MLKQCDMTPRGYSKFKRMGGANGDINAQKLKKSLGLEVKSPKIPCPKSHAEFLNLIKIPQRVMIKMKNNNTNLM